MEQKKKNPLIDILINVVAPTLILIKLSKPEYLGQINALLLAVAIPFGYGLYHLIKEKKVEYLSILGLVSVLLTGGIGLLELDGFWIAIKEAAIPLIIGIVVLVSTFTPYPLVEKMLFNPEFMEKDLILENARQKSNETNLQKRLRATSYIVVLSFGLSAILNFVLARVIVTAEPGSVLFNEQLGKMQGLSFPVIALPTTLVLAFALYFLIMGIRKYTGMELKEIMKQR
jgi:hypothetical protein